MSEKKVLIEVGNVRIKEYDSLNVTVERYEDVFIPQKKAIEKRWQFKGYSKGVLSALLFIQRNELLINKNNVSDLNGYLNEVQHSNEQLSKVVRSHV